MTSTRPCSSQRYLKQLLSPAQVKNQEAYNRRHRYLNARELGMATYRELAEHAGISAHRMRQICDKARYERSRPIRGLPRHAPIDRAGGVNFEGLSKREAMHLHQALEGIKHQLHRDWLHLD